MNIPLNSMEIKNFQAKENIKRNSKRAFNACEYRSKFRGSSAKSSINTTTPIILSKKVGYSKSNQTTQTTLFLKILFN